MDTKKFQQISYKTVNICAICGKDLYPPIIELEKFPLVAKYTRTPIKKEIGTVDLKFHFCENCGHGQLSNIIDPKILYSTDYFHQTSQNPMGMDSNKDLILFVEHLIGNKQFETILDIGCNDLYLLTALKSKSKKLIGIDPFLQNKAEKLSNDKLTILPNFIEDVNLKPILEKRDCLILSNHTLEHIENPKEMIKKLFQQADNKTIFVFQFPSLELLIKKIKFFEIFHDHVHYFSLSSFTHMLNELNGELIDYKFNLDCPFGSLQVAFKKASGNKTNPSFKKLDSKKILEKYNLFKENMEITNKLLESCIGKKIYGYGAPMLLPVLNYHLKNKLSFLECIFDDDKKKDNLYYINLPVCIKNFKSEDLKNSIIIITALNHLRPILANVIFLNPRMIILPINYI
jgi:2-polyprenyl-3-methyl-5-hydroxy-6-metoxy-1,4-benzoquinol methylase